MVRACVIPRCHQCRPVGSADGGAWEWNAKGCCERWDEGSWRMQWIIMTVVVVMWVVVLAVVVVVVVAVAVMAIMVVMVVVVGGRRKSWGAGVALLAHPGYKSPSTSE